MPSLFPKLLKQSVFLPKPPLTEKNCPDQRGRVHLVTGGYSGCGQELARMLYQHNATVFIAGRNAEKYRDTEAYIKRAVPSSQGSLQFVQLDFSDLSSIKPAVDKFLAQSDRLDVLTNNAAVMEPPASSRTAQDEELQMGTNCLGPWLLYQLLRPRLIATAKRADTAAGTIRVTWAASLSVDAMAPAGGVSMVRDPAKGQSMPKIFDDSMVTYSQSKAANIFMANCGAARDAIEGVIHVVWNPGNLQTSLWRHGSPMRNWFLNALVLYPPIFGAYTELFAALSGNITAKNSGCYVYPWGRIGEIRDDIRRACEPNNANNTCVRDEFIAWCDSRIKPFR